MAQTPVTTGNHSFQNYDGWARYRTPATVLWGSGGNVCTITDPKIATNSCVHIWVTGAIPAIGTGWAYAITSGQVVITSTDGENTGLTMSYIIL